MIDEADALIGDTLISLLRQLRDGYIGRAHLPFPQSVILCGLRDVRDYRFVAGDYLKLVSGIWGITIVLDNPTIALKTGLTEDEVQQLHQP